MRLQFASSRGLLLRVFIALLPPGAPGAAAGNHTTGECWLKYQAGWDNNVDRAATNLVVNARGPYPDAYRQEHKTSPGGPLGPAGWQLRQLLLSHALHAQPAVILALKGPDHDARPLFMLRCRACPVDGWTDPTQAVGSGTAAGHVFVTPHDISASPTRLVTSSSLCRFLDLITLKCFSVLP